MKKTVLLAIPLVSLHTYAQPVIQDASNIATPGFSAPVFIATVAPSIVLTGPGANQTWDFTTPDFVYTSGGNLDVIVPSTAPMGGSFPAANYAYTFASTYSFFNVSASKMEVQALTIVAAGTGNDYTPNPRTQLIFPFNFNDSAVDTYQKVGGSQGTVTITYDAYGTLITPSGTYTNVVRVRDSYGPGDNDYEWYILNPLTQVAIYDSTNNTLYHIGATQISGIEDNTVSGLSLFPNPATDLVTVSNLPAGSTVRITDMTGRKVYSRPAGSENTLVNTSDFANGVYLVQVENNKGVLTQKLIINQ
ncbi:MAG: T9SS type A sorting domain-containing protein [Bacteroidia bacterium]|nr:T9SS type A sorting domain-containing protein [Bacteroidia bacterium]